MKLSPKIIITYSLIVLIALYITENIFHPSYLIQLIQKVLSFVIIPLIISNLLKNPFWRFWNITKSSYIYGIWLWLLWWITIFISYYLLKDIIEWDSIQKSMTNRWITETTFILVFSYIMFWNSLVEEYFFRWIIFNTLKDTHKSLSYILSSTLFSLYHITIFWTWFHGYILLIALVWLFLWWLFFAWLYKKTSWVWWARFFHIIADAVILVIWYYTFFR